MSILCIIPLAGNGSRFKALSKYHKALLPIDNKEVLGHIVDNLKDKVDKFIFVVSDENKDVIVKYAETLKVNWQYVTQNRRDGPLGAFGAGLVHDRNHYDSVLLHLGDMFVDDELNFDKSFLSYQEVSDYSRWCMIDDELNIYDKAIVRPNTNKALNGLYFFKDAKKAFELYEEVKFREEPLTNIEWQISQLLNRYKKFETFELRQIKVVDVGTIDDFLKLNNFKNHRDTHHILIEDDVVIKKSLSHKLTKEFYHLKALSEQNWNIPEIQEFNFSTKTRPSMLGMMITNKGIEAFDDSMTKNMLSYELEKITNESFDYSYIFEDFSLEYYEEKFNRLLSHLKNITKKYGSDSFTKDLHNVVVDRKLIEDEKVAKLLMLVDDREVLTHGDFQFANIIFDKNEESEFYVIDPSGRFIHTRNYDLAKLMHSALYDYNLIKFNLFKVKDDNIIFYNEHLENKKKVFNSVMCKYFTPEEVIDAKIICCILFKTMQSLHEEEHHIIAFEYIHNKIYDELVAEGIITK